MAIEKTILTAMLKRLARALPRWAPNLDDAETLGVWVKQLSHLNQVALGSYLGTLIATADGYPSIAQILKSMERGSSLSDKDIGEELAFRIEKAIRLYGYTNWKEAKEYLGEIGTEIITRIGGWQSICETREADMASARRQWRELGRILSLKASEGTLHQAPRFPTDAAMKGKNSLAAKTIKQLAEALETKK